MSDRCFIQLVCSAEHAARFTNEPLDLPVIDSPGTALSACGLAEIEDVAEFEDLEFCGFDDLPQDVPYIARHGTGHGYAPAEIVCDGASTSYFTSSTVGSYEVEVDEDGTISASSNEQLRRHLQIKRAAITSLANEEVEAPTL